MSQKKELTEYLEVMEEALPEITLPIQLMTRVAKHLNSKNKAKKGTPLKGCEQFINIYTDANGNAVIDKDNPVNIKVFDLVYKHLYFSYFQQNEVATKKEFEDKFYEPLYNDFRNKENGQLDFLTGKFLLEILEPKLSEDKRKEIKVKCVSRDTTLCISDFGTKEAIMQALREVYKHKTIEATHTRMNESLKHTYHDNVSWFDGDHNLAIEDMSLPVYQNNFERKKEYVKKHFYNK